MPLCNTGIQTTMLAIHSNSLVKEQESLQGKRFKYMELPLGRSTASEVSQYGEWGCPVGWPTHHPIRCLLGLGEDLEEPLLKHKRGAVDLPLKLYRMPKQSFVSPEYKVSLPLMSEHSTHPLSQKVFPHQALRGSLHA